MTIKEFIKDNGITMTVKPTQAKEGDFGSRHFLCLLRMDNRQMTIRFHQGSGHTSDPTLEDVLDCVASDAAGVLNSTGFEEWASEYGYDEDSRSAEKIYNACVKQTDKLRALLDDDGNLLEELCFEVEKL